MWLQTIFLYFKTYPDYFEIQHSNSSAFSILYINKQHKIIPWSNKENKHLAVWLWFPMQMLSFDPKGEEGRAFSFLLMEPSSWEVHITTKISPWEKYSSNLTVLSTLRRQVSPVFPNTVELVSKQWNSLSESPIGRDLLIKKCRS